MTLKDCLNENCPDGFENLAVIHCGSWSSYEENGHIVVFDFFGELFAVDWGHCVMSEDDSFYFEPYQITEQELFDIKQEYCEEYL